jgi:hypothetical protein
MDLGAIKRKLELKRYKNISECADDFRLVWNNCKTYNVEGSDFYILADTLSKKFEDRYKKLCSERKYLLFISVIGLFFTDKT